MGVATGPSCSPMTADGPRRFEFEGQAARRWRGLTAAKGAVSSDTAAAASPVAGAPGRRSPRRRRCPGRRAMPQPTSRCQFEGQGGLRSSKCRHSASTMGACNQLMQLQCRRPVSGRRGSVPGSSGWGSSSVIAAGGWRLAGSGWRRASSGCCCCWLVAGGVLEELFAVPKQSSDLQTGLTLIEV